MEMSASQLVDFGLGRPLDDLWATFGRHLDDLWAAQEESLSLYQIFFCIFCIFFAFFCILGEKLDEL